MKKLRYLLGVAIFIIAGICIQSVDAQAKNIGDGGEYKNVATNYNVGDMIVTSAPYYMDGDYNSLGHNYYKMKIDKKSYLSLVVVTTKHDEQSYITIEDANGSGCCLITLQIRTIWDISRYILNWHYHRVRIILM